MVWLPMVKDVASTAVRAEAVAVAHAGVKAGMTVPVTETVAPTVSRGARVVAALRPVPTKTDVELAAGVNTKPSMEPSPL